MKKALNRYANILIILLIIILASIGVVTYALVNVVNIQPELPIHPNNSNVLDFYSIINITNPEYSFDTDPVFKLTVKQDGISLNNVNSGVLTKQTEFGQIQDISEREALEMLNNKVNIAYISYFFRLNEKSNLQKLMFAR